MYVDIDIETIPGQGLLPSFMEDAKNNFRAPSGLSKKQALVDMGLDGEKKPQKFWTKDDTIKEWEVVMCKDKAKEVAEENWRKTALNGAQGEVISIAWSVAGEPIKHAVRTLESDEKALIESVFSLIDSSLNGRPPVFAGHNVKFDLKFLYRRACILGIKPPFNLPFRGRHGKDYFCTSEAWCEYQERVSLHDLCRFLGIQGKPDDIDGSKVWDFIKAGHYDRVAEYNCYDVERVQLIRKRLF